MSDLYAILARKPYTKIVVNIKIGYKSEANAIAALKHCINSDDEAWGYISESDYNRMIESGELVIGQKSR